MSGEEEEEEEEEEEGGAYITPAGCGDSPVDRSPHGGTRSERFLFPLSCPRRNSAATHEKQTKSHLSSADPGFVLIPVHLMF